MEVRIIWTGKNMAKAASKARGLGGKYHADTQTWTVNPQLFAAAFASTEPRYFGLEVVQATPRSAPSGCRLWTDEQGCPLHGEDCN